MQLIPPPVDIVDDDTFATATDENVPTAESTKAYVDAEVAGAVSTAFLFRRIRQGLTNKSSWSATTGPEQWGTEEAVYTLGVGEPTDVTVFAQAHGYCQTGGSTANVTVYVQISIDGGSTWSDGQSIAIRDEGGASSNNRRPLIVEHQLDGVTPTGEIQARVVGQVATNTTGRTLNSGVIYLTVVGGDPLA